MADSVDKSDDATLTKLVGFFDDAEQETIEARKQSEIDRDYFDGIQWTIEEKAELESRHQPCLTFNKIQPKVNFLTGHEIQSRVDPKAFPRNAPDDEEAAQAATDAIRFVVDKEDGPEKFSQAYEDMLIEGFGGIEVTAEEKKSGQIEIGLKHWHWDRLFYDPHSRRHDFSDARYKGGVTWMDEEAALDKWPNKKEEIEGTVSIAREERAHDDTYDDRPRWVDFSPNSANERKRIRIVQIYWKQDGDWWWAIYTRGGILDGNQKVLFIDDEQETVCPLILQSVYVTRENRRYGEVRRLRDIQDEVNKRRSKLLHQLSVRQVRFSKGAVDNIEIVRRELAKPDGVFSTNPGAEFELISNADQVSGQAALLQESKDEMELAGPNAALSGKQGGDPSGRAILASQQGGIIELTSTLTRFRHLKLTVYRHIWMRIRQFWTEERWVRVTDDENNVKFVGFNRPVTALEEATRQLQEKAQEIQEDGRDPEEDEQFQAQLQLTEQNTDELRNTVVRAANVAAEMDMDIILDETPDVITLQQEQFAEITNLAQAGVPIPPEIIIELSSLQNKDKVLEQLKEGTQPGPAEQLQLQELQKKIEKMDAEIVNLRAKSIESLAKADVADGQADGLIAGQNGAVQ